MKFPRFGGLAGGIAVNTTLPLLPTPGCWIWVETLGGTPRRVRVTLPVVPVRVSTTVTVALDWFWYTAVAFEDKATDKLGGSVDDPEPPPPQPTVTPSDSKIATRAQ